MEIQNNVDSKTDEVRFIIIIYLIYANDLTAMTPYLTWDCGAI